MLTAAAAAAAVVWRCRWRESWGVRRKGRGPAGSAFVTGFAGAAGSLRRARGRAVFGVAGVARRRMWRCLFGLVFARIGMKFVSGLLVD